MKPLIADTHVGIVREMSGNVRRCPNEKCGTCIQSLDILDRSFEEVVEIDQNKEDKLEKIKKYALSRWVGQDMWDAMEEHLASGEEI